MTEEQKKLTPEEQEVIIKKMKDRVLGNMKFIGQLYLRKLLSHKVVREVTAQGISCRDRLFRPRDPFLGLRTSCPILLIVRRYRLSRGV